MSRGRASDRNKLFMFRDRRIERYATLLQRITNGQTEGRKTLTIVNIKVRTYLPLDKYKRYRCVVFKMFLKREWETLSLVYVLSWIINFRFPFQNKVLQSFSIIFFFTMRAWGPNFFSGFVGEGRRKTSFWWQYTPIPSKWCHVAFKQKQFHIYQWQKIDKDLYCCNFFSFAELRANIHTPLTNLSHLQHSQENSQNTLN